jgi:hypothetical protein
MEQLKRCYGTGCDLDSKCKRFTNEVNSSLDFDIVPTLYDRFFLYCPNFVKMDNIRCLHLDDIKE